MGFGGKIQDRVWTRHLEQMPDHVAVGDVALDEVVAGTRLDVFEGGEVRRVSQLVEIEDPPVRLADQISANRGTNKTGSAGDDHPHYAPLNGLTLGPRRCRNGQRLSTRPFSGVRGQVLGAA